jgi:hypothetical protein
MRVFMMGTSPHVEPLRNQRIRFSDGGQRQDPKHVVLSGPLKGAADPYGVVALAGLHAQRWTFYVYEDGRIRQIDKNADVATAGEDIARTLEALGFPGVEQRPPGIPLGGVYCGSGTGTADGRGGGTAGYHSRTLRA